MGSFFALLHKNVLDQRTWATREQLRVAIVVRVERTYRHRRQQARLGRLAPIEFETTITTPAALAAGLQPVTYPCSSPGISSAINAGTQCPTLHSLPDRTMLSSAA